MMENKSYYFEIDDERFVFCKNNMLSQYSAKYRIMIYDTSLGWVTINYPKNITEAKKMAKDFLKNS